MKSTLDETIDEFLFEEQEYVETAMQEEYDEEDEEDIRVKEKEEFSDSSGYARPHTPNNSDMADEQSEKMMKGKEFAHYDFYDSTTEDIQDDQLKKKLGLRTSKSMPQIHKELNGLDIEL